MATVAYHYIGHLNLQGGFETANALQLVKEVQSMEQRENTIRPVK